MKNFLIVGTQRTGSSALGDGLGLHPHVVCGWEWTLGVAPWKALTMARDGLSGRFDRLQIADRKHMAESNLADAKMLGFRKLFRSSNKWVAHPRLAPALLLDRLEGHLIWLRKHSDIKILHIVREDNLAWIKSKALSQKSGSYFGKPYAEDLVASIAAEEAVKRIIAKNWVDDRLSSLRSTNPYLHIRYESFLKDNTAVLDEALRFLEVDPSLLPSPEQHMHAKPQSKKPPRECLSNFDELEAVLSEKGLLRSAPGY